MRRVGFHPTLSVARQHDRQKYRRNTDTGFSAFSVAYVAFREKSLISMLKRFTFALAARRLVPHLNQCKYDLHSLHTHKDSKMQTALSHAETSGPMTWLRRAEAWLDDKGKGAWIAAMVLAFIFVWPLGLALLAYMIWSDKMFCSSSRRKHKHKSPKGMSRSSGNTAFDAYKADTLQRLEEEQENFEAFLQRLRDARDKAEFDQFMDERAAAANTPEDPQTREA